MTPYANPERPCSSCGGIGWHEATCRYGLYGARRWSASRTVTILRLVDAQGPTTSGRLARHLGVPVQAVQRALTRLAALRLVSRSDGRARGRGAPYVYRVTPAGQEHRPARIGRRL